jgi:SAM-dependent methyltransferase
MPALRTIVKYVATAAGLFDPAVSESARRPAADESDRVVREWGRVYHTHPDAFTIRRPEAIGRLAHRDLPRLLADLCAEPGRAVLEDGCGSGQDALFLASLGHRVTALDANVDAVEHLVQARDRYTRSHGAVVLDVLAGDLLSPPFPPSSFDLVFNSGVVEHLSRDLRRDAIRAMARMVRPRGHVVVVVPNASHPFGPLWAWLVDHTTDHARFDLAELAVTVGDLAMDLESAACDLVETCGIDPWRTLELHPSWLPLRGLARIGERLDPFHDATRRHLATRLVAVGRRR